MRPQPAAGPDQPGPRVAGDQLFQLGVAHVLRLRQAAGAEAVRDDVGPHVPGHHESDPDMGRVGAQVLDERLGETPHRELGRAVGRLRRARAQRRPEAVHAAGVDQDAVRARDQQRQERAGAVVDAGPVDGERPLPLFPVTADKAAAAADARVAEDQVHVIGAVLLQHLIAEPQNLPLVGNVTGMAGHPDLGHGDLSRDGRGLRDGLRVQVTRRDRASLHCQLAGKLAAHAGTAAGHHRELPGK